MRFAAILFDLDGTLIDSLADIADSCNRILASRGYSIHPHDAYRYFIGDGVKHLLLRSLPPEARVKPGLGQCIEAFNADYARRWHIKTRPYPGIPSSSTPLGRRACVWPSSPTSPITSRSSVSRRSSPGIASAE